MVDRLEGMVSRYMIGQMAREAGVDPASLCLVYIDTADGPEAVLIPREHRSGKGLGEIGAQVRR